MHFSFLVVVTALAACISVTACSQLADRCTKDRDCCSGLRCDFVAVSMSSLPPIQVSTPLLTPCNANSPMVTNSAIYRCDQWAGSLPVSTSGQQVVFLLSH
ncbi:hypothetical protein EDB19DRAFT_1689214 [Suillus lakei]|nr:hypothetical protein EDB19DRAFT_1689214 [Suillus lakei]